MSFSDSKSPQVSGTLLSILAVLNNIVVWMFSTRSPTSKSSSPFSNPLVTVPRAPITIGIIVIYMFPSFFFQSPSNVEVHPSFHILSVLFCGQPGQQSPQFCSFSFSSSILILSWFGSYIPSVRCFLTLFMTSRAHFLMPNSIPMSWLYILTVSIRVSSSFSFFADSFMSSIYIRWLIFSCDLLSLYPAVHFLSMWFSDIMAIMNGSGDRASPWKTPLWIFVSAKLFPPAVNSTLQFFMFFFRWSLWLCVIFCTFETVYYPALRNHIICLFASIQAIARFFVCSCFHLGCVDLCSVTLLCLWIFFGILSVRQGTIRGLLASCISLPLFVLLIFYTSSVNMLWVYNCLEQFLYLGPFGLMLSSLWSSSQVLLHLEGICSFLVLVCREWGWIS